MAAPAKTAQVSTATNSAIPSIRTSSWTLTAQVMSGRLHFSLDHDSGLPASPTPLNEFSDTNNDECRRNEHRLRTQCAENACPRERGNGPPEAVFRNPAFD